MAVASLELILKIMEIYDKILALNPCRQCEGLMKCSGRIYSTLFKLLGRTDEKILPIGWGFLSRGHLIGLHLISPSFRVLEM